MPLKYKGINVVKDVFSPCSTETMSKGNTNPVQAIYRAAKASLSLNLLAEAQSHCQNGLQLDPSNEELKKLGQLIDQKKAEQEKHEAQVSKAVSEAKVIILSAVLEIWFIYTSFIFFV